jgi:hypothetical protein
MNSNESKIWQAIVGKFPENLTPIQREIASSMAETIACMWDDDSCSNELARSLENSLLQMLMEI